MTDRPELYFPRDVEWYDWLLANHDKYPKGIYLIFYKLEANIPTMRWEEAVKVALCFGWIDSTVKNLGGPKRRQYFCPRKPKSGWSALNKTYLKLLMQEGKMQPPGLHAVAIAKENGSWAVLDNVEKGIIPKELQQAFDQNSKAFENYQKFSKGYQKSYLRWVYEAKREETKTKRIEEVIRLCEANVKSR